MKQTKGEQKEAKVQRFCPHCNEEITEKDFITAVVYRDGTILHYQCAEDLIHIDPPDIEY